MEIPEQIETQRLILRPYHAGDGKMYFAVGQMNRDHLQRYEAMNIVLRPENEGKAEGVVCELEAAWAERSSFFMGGFSKATHEFIVQIYIGVINWETGEFELGYFVDCDHLRQGYAIEAGWAALRFIFGSLNGHRVRLECSDTNMGSMRVAEELGFILESHCQDEKQELNGSYSGTKVYGLLASDFPQKIGDSNQRTPLAVE